MQRILSLSLFFLFTSTFVVIAQEITEIEMVTVEGGTFVMGFDPEETVHAYESPKHTVTVDTFKIGKHEVTQDLWEAVMGDNPSANRKSGLPVENVSWNDVQVFIDKLNNLTGRHFRLPTEAEWEFASRGGNLSESYTFPGSNEIDNVAWHFGNSGKTTHPVGILAPNELGIFDMAGNVSEWTQDWFGPYSSKKLKNPKGPRSSTIGKILRGGSSFVLAAYNRHSCRSVSNPNFRSPTIGFRLAE